MIAFDEFEVFLFLHANFEAELEGGRGGGTDGRTDEWQE